MHDLMLFSKRPTPHHMQNTKHTTQIRFPQDCVATYWIEHALRQLNDPKKKSKARNYWPVWVEVADGNRWKRQSVDKVEVHINVGRMREQLLYFDDEQIQKPRKRRQPHQKPRNSIVEQYNRKQSIKRRRWSITSKFFSVSNLLQSV